MEKRKIKDLKRGEYIPQAKCYSTYKWENINHEVIRRGDKEVYTDFTF